MRSILFTVAMTVLAVCGSSAAPTNPKESLERLPRYIQQVEADLRENILPFWLKRARDKERGGFYGQLNDDSGVTKDAPRGALLTTRILWTFSAAYRRYPDPAYLEMARWAFDDLMARFWDRQSGGLFWSISADGVPLDPRKVLYVQSFGVYSLSEFYLATGDRQPLDRAIELYGIIEKQAHDSKNLGYFEEFTRDWKKTTARGGKGSAMGSLGQKSQNTHLHMLEAYTNLLRAWSDPRLKKNLAELIEIMLSRIMDPSTNHLNLFFEENWKPSSHEFSYGHDIEFSWLITEAAEVLGDADLIVRARHAAEKVAEVTLREGVESSGGIVAEGTSAGVTNTYKEWWSQAEGAVGFANAFQLSGDVSYLDASMKTWDFIEQNLIDRKNGDWFIGIAKDGRVAGQTKISFWKCPYHNGRACLELIRRFGVIRESHSN